MRLGFDPLGNEAPRLAELRIRDIERDREQPRKDLGDLSGLQASIAVHGVLEPIIVSPLDEERFRLVAGERRLTAATLLGRGTIPAIIRTVEEHQRLEIQLMENLHRKDLNPVEEARAFRRLMEEFGLAQRDLAQRLGKSPAAINQTLRILDLPETILSHVQTSEYVSRSLLLEIAKEPEPENQIALWQEARNGELTVKKARERKLRARKPPLPRCDIFLEQATVTIQFKSEAASPTDVVIVLRAALHEYLDHNASLLPGAAEASAGEDLSTAPPAGNLIAGRHPPVPDTAGVK